MDGRIHACALQTLPALDTETVLQEMDVVAAARPYVPTCGVYFLISDNRVRYVGQSSNVEARLAAHRRHRKFDAVAVIPCSPDKLNILESLYIHQYQPDWNARLLTGRLKAPISLERLPGCGVMAHQTSYEVLQSSMRTLVVA